MKAKPSLYRKQPSALPQGSLQNMGRIGFKFGCVPFTLLFSALFAFYADTCIGFSHGFGKLLKGLTLGIGQALWDFNGTVDQKVALGAAVQALDALTAQAEGRAALGALGNFILNIARERGYGDFAAEDSYGHADGVVEIQIVSFADELLMVPYADRHKKIAFGTAVIAHAALTAEAEGLSVIYACGDIDGNGFCNYDTALTFTALAWILYNISS